MPTTMLTSGPMHLLASGEVYALPGRAVYIAASGAGTLEISSDNGSSFAALGTGNPIVATHIRSTGGTKNIVIKPL